MRAIGDFFPLGTGIGSFPAIYYRYASMSLGRYYDIRAHNDYLEWLLEGGLVGAVILLAWILLYLIRWYQVWANKQDSSLYYAQLGAAIGLFLVLLHGLVDIGAHIPANAIYIAFLGGLLFYPLEASKGKRSKHRSSSNNEYRKQVMAKLAASDQKKTIPNPFLE